MLTVLLAETTAQIEGSADEGGGFPPFDFWHWPSQIFWLLITFSVLYLVLSRSILPRIGGTIERRGSQVASDLDEAAMLNEQAADSSRALEVELARARGNARETATAAHARMEEEIARETARVDAEIETELAAAEARIGEMRAAAMAKVEGIATQTVRTMVGRLGQEIDEDAARSAVRAHLD